MVVAAKLGTGQRSSRWRQRGPWGHGARRSRDVRFSSAENNQYIQKLVEVRISAAAGLVVGRLLQAPSVVKPNGMRFALCQWKPTRNEMKPRG